MNTLIWCALHLAHVYSKYLGICTSRLPRVHSSMREYVPPNTIVSEYHDLVCRLPGTSILVISKSIHAHSTKRTNEYVRVCSTGRDHTLLSAVVTSIIVSPPSVEGCRLSGISGICRAHACAWSWYYIFPRYVVRMCSIIIYQPVFRIEKWFSDENETWL